jgi:hypothetical protein
VSTAQIAPNRGHSGYRQPRADLRLEISVNVAAYLSGTRTPVALKDVSAGGCLIESALSLARDSIHQLRFTTASGASVTLIGRVLHCRRPIFGPANRWLVGFTFAHATNPSVQCQIAALLGAPTTGRSLGRAVESL